MKGEVYAKSNNYARITNIVARVEVFYSWCLLNFINRLVFRIYQRDGIYVSRNGTGLVQKYLQECFNGYGEVRELRIDYDEAIEVHTSEQIRVRV